MTEGLPGADRVRGLARAFASAPALVLSAAIFGLGAGRAGAQEAPPGTAAPRPPAASAAAPVPARTAPFGEAEGLFDIVYARLPGGRELRLDLFRPRRKATEDGGAPVEVPCVVYIHGGGWEGGDRRTAPQAIDPFVRRGYAVAAVEYRLTGEARFPAQIHDVKRAIRYLRFHAAALGLDGERMAAFGMSAGGHLAALAALAGPADGLEPPALDGDPEGLGRAPTALSAASSWAGPTDLLRCETPKNRDTVRRLLSKLLGASREEAPERYRQASPLTFVDANDPPLFLVHGRDDELVIPEQAEALRDAMRAAGAVEETVLALHMGHGNPTGPRPIDPPLDEIQRRFLDFLDRHVKRAPVLR